MHRFPRGLLLLALVLSGCASQQQESDPAGTATDLGPVSPAAPSPVVNATSLRRESVYAFHDMVTGASPPDAGRPPALTATFEVPAGVAGLTFGASQDGGLGSARIEVKGPGNEAVFVSDQWECAGGPDPARTCIGQTTSRSQPAPAAQPGNYTLEYYVGGAFTLVVDVSILVPEPSVQEGGGGQAGIQIVESTNNS